MGGAAELGESVVLEDEEVRGGTVVLEVRVGMEARAGRPKYKRGL